MSVVWRFLLQLVVRTATTPATRILILFLTAVFRGASGSLSLLATLRIAHWWAEVRLARLGASASNPTSLPPFSPAMLSRNVLQRSVQRFAKTLARTEKVATLTTAVNLPPTTSPHTVTPFRTLSPRTVSTRFYSSSSRALGKQPFLLADIGEGIAEVELLQWFVAEGDTISQVRLEDKLQDMQCEQLLCVKQDFYDAFRAVGIVAALVAVRVPLCVFALLFMCLQAVLGGSHIHIQFDRVCEVQSDKATVEITSRYDGKILSLNGAVGDMMQVGEALLDLEVEGAGSHVEVASKSPGEMETPLSIPALQAAAVPAATHSSHGARTPADPSSPHHPSSKILTTPAVRKMAKENNVDLNMVAGSGSKGRILKEDLQAFLSGGSGGWVTPPAAAPAAANAAAAPVFTPSNLANMVPPADRTEPIRGYARLMVQSMNAALKIPHFGYNDEIRLNDLADLRKSLKPLAESQGVKLSYMPLFIKAASLALHSYPVLNASISADETEIHYHGSHNIGVAMDTEKGLVVPNIKNCQNLSVFEIAAELNRLQFDGQNGGIKTGDLGGTTFTLSNIGAIGGTYMVPVIAAPQVAIGALGKLQELPRFGADGEVERALMMAVSWAGDHRIVDGATMARFSNEWKAYLETPGSMVAKMR